MFSGFFSSVAIARQESQRDCIVSYARTYVFVCVSGRVERGGSAIIVLIARNPTTCIYQVFLFSARVGVFHYTFPISYSDFWEGAGRVSGSGWG